MNSVTLQPVRILVGPSTITEIYAEPMGAERQDAERAPAEGADAWEESLRVRRAEARRVPKNRRDASATTFELARSRRGSRRALTAGGRVVWEFGGTGPVPLCGTLAAALCGALAALCAWMMLWFGSAHH